VGDTMLVAGKCPPEPDALRAAADRGFDAVELYLRTDHLDEMDDALAAVDNAPVEVASVHTPHCALSETAYFRAADELAVALDAYLVVHSVHVNLSRLSTIEELDLESPHGYENHAGTSPRYLESAILHRGCDLVVDTAHLFMADSACRAELARLLDEYGSQIRLVHLNDATRYEDGLPFGDGEVDMRGVTRLLKRRFDGIVVLEVMPADQREALDLVEDVSVDDERTG
jgi:sugar phosphate isomerase/epimerase